eukprot:TRINITY_DN575_c1_g2_i1.p1 TRINITY_DN575_c1_g2~~TRINITY_DN575_c1_g2_i1.p1  ORF type:complete len:872 (-),score=161.89 TRINITY_DN575_c1_g2_i1:366-2981(-)
MASKVSKNRLVHCPKCGQLLKVTANVYLYVCGGCNAILQSRKRSGSGRGSSTGTRHETDPVQKNESGHEENESITSSNRSIICPTDTNCGKGPVESTDCGNNMPECRGNSSQISASGELNRLTKEAVVETGMESDCLEGRNPKEIPVTNGQLPSEGMHLNAISSSDELNYHGKEVIAETGDHGHESDPNLGKGSNPEGSKRSGLLASMAMNNTTVPAMQSDMNIQMKVDKSSLNEQVEQSQMLGRCISDYTTLEDDLEGTNEPTNHSTSHGILSKSPTSKSSCAYYGSVSSYGDDLDDHVPDHHVHSGRKSLTEQRSVDSLNKKGWPMQQSDSELQSEERNFVSMPSNENYGSIITGSNRQNQDKPSGHSGHGFQAKEKGTLEEPDVFHSVRSWIEPERDVPSRSPSRDLRYRKELPSLYRIGSSSSYGHEELSCSTSSSSYASGKLQRLEQDQMKLLTKVEELTDQLQRIYRQKGQSKVHGRVSQIENWRPSGSSYNPGQQLPWHYNAEYPWNPPGTYGPRKAMPLPYGLTQIPTPEQVTNRRHHVDYSCLHCYSQDSQYPLHLPPSFHHKKGPCRACASHGCHHSYGSSVSSSSQQHSNSIFPQQYHNAQPHEQMEKLHIKEKHQPVKRHCRPMAGGAPFVICYKCCKVLQIPADFLLPRRRHHKLQCGACSKELMFSVNDSIHKSPNGPSQVQHPPSEVDRSTDTVTKELASLSHVADCYLQGDPVSYSDDYANSLSKSYSTEGEPALLDGPLHVLPSFARDKNNHASSSTNPRPMRQKKKLASKVFGDESGKLKEVFGSPIPSSEATESEKSSEATAGTLIKGSPLHQLMGYSSPSAMINGCNPPESCHSKSYKQGSARKQNDSPSA